MDNITAPLQVVAGPYARFLDLVRAALKAGTRCLRHVQTPCKHAHSSIGRPVPGKPLARQLPCPECHVQTCFKRLGTAVIQATLEAAKGDSFLQAAKMKAVAASQEAVRVMHLVEQEAANSPRRHWLWPKVA